MWRERKDKMDNTLKDFRLFAKDKGVSGMLFDDYTSKMPYDSYIEPTVLEERKNMNLISISVFSRLLMERIIFLGTEINSDVSNIISAQLLWLDSVDPSKDVTLQVSSGGGSVYDGYKILDSMDFIACDVSTISMGMVASMAAVIACNGTKGKRFILPRARFMIHQPLGGNHGQTSDVVITANEMVKIRTELYQGVSDNSNLSYEEIERMADRDCYMDAETAIKYGFMDEIIKNKKNK